MEDDLINEIRRSVLEDRIRETQKSGQVDMRALNALLKMSSNALDREMKNTKSNKILKIDRRLPQILVPEDKVKMFVDWWNSDIRFETSIPHAFNEGYIIIDNIQSSLGDVNEYSTLIKSIAGAMHTTYRNIENQFNEFIKSSQHITLYFTFTDENSMYVETYDTSNKIISTMSFTVGQNSGPEKEINLTRSTVQKTSFNEVLDEMNYYHLGVLISCLWYIATTTKSTKYIYENKAPMVVGRQRGTVQVSDTKFIKTPIYDMKKVKTVKVETLTARKKGWTYSHSFEVHGHYRHYKNGKVIFIKPFIKGKDKEFKAQTIVLEPDNERGDLSE